LLLNGKRRRLVPPAFLFCWLPDCGERIIEPFFDDPFPDYDTEPVMAYANDPAFAA
jgi:hypothetical protein